MCREVGATFLNVKVCMESVIGMTAELLSGLERSLHSRSIHAMRYETRLHRLIVRAICGTTKVVIPLLDPRRLLRFHSSSKNRLDGKPISLKMRINRVATAHLEARLETLSWRGESQPARQLERKGTKKKPQQAHDARMKAIHL